MVHCTFLGVSSYTCNFKKNHIVFSEDYFTFTKNVEPDEMQHYAAFHLVLHFLQKYLFRGFPNTKGLLIITL